MKRFGPKHKIIAATMFAIFSLFSTMCACFAWFTINNPSIKFETVSGDMSISVKKVSAYRYVYPYYTGSNSFIDYQAEASIKEYIILNDSNESFQTPDTSAVTEDTNNNSYYIVGDKTFIGTDKFEEYQTSSGIIFATKGDSLVADGVPLSKGAHLAITKNNKDFFQFKNITSNNNENISTKENKFITINRAGIYDFEMNKNSLTLNRRQREDDAILEMTIFDPTYALLQGQGDSKAVAIYNQNTCLIYDILIDVKNDTHDFELTLDAKRNLISGKENLSNYVTLRTKEETEDIRTGDEIYNLFHDPNLTEEEKKIYNTGDDVKVFNANEDKSTLFQKEYSSTAKQTSVHLYIAIDYDPNRIGYFFNQDKLGREYELMRDFGFYFTSKQKTGKESKK